MSLEEAQLILNVKKDEPMDVIQRVCHTSYERLDPKTRSTHLKPGADVP